MEFPSNQDKSGCAIVLPERANVAYSAGLSGGLAVVPFERLDRASVGEDIAALVYAVGVPRLARLTTVVIVEPDCVTDAGRSIMTAAVLAAVSVGACIVGIPAAVIRDQFAALNDPESVTVENVLAFVEASRRQAWLRGLPFGEVLRPRDFEMAGLASFGLDELLRRFAGLSVDNDYQNYQARA